MSQRYQVVGGTGRTVLSCASLDVAMDYATKHPAFRVWHMDATSIEVVAASELKVGDVFSTDSLRVTSVTLLSGGGAPDEIAVSGICHGIEKFAYLSPDFPCPLWRGDSA